MKYSMERTIAITKMWRAIGEAIPHMTDEELIAFSKLDDDS